MKKKSIVKKIIRKKKTTPQHFCVAEDCMLLEGGVLYGFTGFKLHDLVGTLRYSIVKIYCNLKNIFSLKKAYPINIKIEVANPVRQFL